MKCTESYRKVIEMPGGRLNFCAYKNTFFAWHPNPSQMISYSMDLDCVRGTPVVCLYFVGEHRPMQFIAIDAAAETHMTE